VRGRWGSKGRASWKVTLSSRRWVLYRFGLPHPVLPFFGLVRNTQSQSRLFFFKPSSRFSLLPRLWPPVTCSLISSMPSCAQIRPPSLPPFFSHGNSNLSDGRVDLAQSSLLSPTPHSCPALYRTGTCVPPSLPSLSFALSLPFPLPLRSPIAPLPCSLPTSFRAYFGISYPRPRSVRTQGSSGFVAARLISPISIPFLTHFMRFLYAVPSRRRSAVTPGRPC